MKTLVFSSHDPGEVLQHIDTEMNGGFRPTLAVVFQSATHDPLGLSQALRERGIRVVGATTSGEIANADVFEDSCSVMAFELAPGSFQTHLSSDDERSMPEKARALGRFATDCFETPVVIAFASGLETDGEAVVHGVFSGAERQIPLFGALAGDDLKMEGTRVFADGRFSPNGLAALVLDGSRYDARGITTSGWQPVGVEKTVTRAEGNIVHAIDGVPALEVYEHYFELGGLQNGRTSIAMDLGVQYPLSVQRENGDAVIRAPIMSLEGSASLVFAGTVPEGARVKFCIPPSLDIVDKVVEEAATVQRDLPEADALLLISCAARKTALGPMIEDEIRGIYDLWDMPLAGLFSYGEIGPNPSGACDFHNETCMLIALREIAN